MARIRVDERKHWVLLVLDAAQGEPLSPVQLQKSLFLVSRKIGLPRDYYRFRPYDYGPFDPEVYRDAEALEAEGLLAISPSQNLKWRLYAITLKGAKVAEDIKTGVPSAALAVVTSVVSHVTALSFNDLVQEIYREYPEYSANSVFRA
jgi:hypothetical protein